MRLLLLESSVTRELRQQCHLCHWDAGAFSKGLQLEGKLYPVIQQLLVLMKNISCLFLLRLN